MTMLAQRALPSNRKNSPDRVTQQIKILNQDYAKANIDFKLVETRRVFNETWFIGVKYMNA